ncbi:hypothetical protein HGO38_01555 [Rhizobium sp. CG5]|uniref:hypothetical protein n=1 Tax=Rhizobium sp. CG5 TaxID=2726076 RepID=UPI0020339A9A|nr:hypothetical protein [Rhizobium sp. CG5]MCM2472162.1 hypothetical protein [Rhizobium sp. CG5]
MTKTLIGKDSDGVGCIKITKGTYNPVTTPDSQAYKFYYNSKWAADVKVQGVLVRPTNTTPGPFYSPTGSGWKYWHSYYGDVQMEIFKKSYFDGVIYNFPLFDIKTVDSETGRYVNGSIGLETTGYAGGRDRAGQWFLRNYKSTGWLAADATYSFSGYFAATVTPSEPSILLRNTAEDRLVVWRLPGDNTDIQNGTEQSAVSGHQQVRLSATECKVSKPGFDVRYATATQLAFDASDVPAKIVAADDISIPEGTSYYETGVSLPENTVVDLHFYQSGGNIIYPSPPLNVEFGAAYWVDGTKIRFANANAACRARFLVIAADTEGPTSGTNKVLRQFTSGGENVVQFLRPGAGSSPSFADIVIDSRWPCLQIVKEGYFSVSVGDDLTHMVTYDASGMFTFVKYMTVHGSGSYFATGSLEVDFTKRVRVPTTGKCAYYNGGWQGYADTGNSSYCVYDNDSAVFHTFRGNPVRKYYRDTEDYDNNVVTVDYDPSPIVGIRYYIFGIAA